MQRCIIVLGMHRSGTSAFSGLLNILGINLGSNYLNPSKDNPKGFFENFIISQLNEQILKSMNSSWDDVFPLPEHWWEKEELNAYKKEIIGVIEKEFTTAGIYAIKDPRLCILFPFWERIFEEINVKPCSIICLRNPIEVAESLRVRNGFSIEKSTILWMKYMIDAEFYSRKFPRVFVSFDALLKSPERTIKDVLKLLDIDFPESYDDVRDDIEQFLEPNLKHHTLELEDADKEGLFGSVMNYYYLLLDVMQSNELSKNKLLQFDVIREEFMRIQRYFYNSDLKMITNEELKKKNEELERKNEELHAIYSSNVWKVANWYYKVRDNILPLRYAYKSFQVIRDEGFRHLLKKVERKAKEGSIKLWGTFRYFLPVDKKGFLSAVNANKYDVIFFSIINWDFRFQRPQQLATLFARNGHRVFYLSVDFIRQTRYLKRRIMENTYEIKLPFKRTTIYNTDIQEGYRSLTEALQSLFHDFKIKESVAVVEFPHWYPLVGYVKNEYATKIIFDCLDEFSGFQGVSADIVEMEDKLIQLSDYCFTSSQSLYDKHRSKQENIAIVRNATEFEHFHNLSPNDLLNNIRKPVIGYYGAMAEWFDIETVEYIAAQKPEWNIVLIGRASGSVVNSLRKYKNIHFLGEQPYANLPRYLYWFDVCLIPFKLNGLTRSTNPVKFYEFISSGKPVVSSPLPELLPYAEYLYISSGKEDFLNNVDTALRENDGGLRNRRIELARANDWKGRFTDIKNCIKSTYPLISVVIVTFNNLEYTKLCIESIYAKTAYPNFELIVVDNASSDGTPDYINALKKKHDNIKIILNKDNRGFACANNIGIEETKGEYIILLNNDVVVTRGWISGLTKYFKDPAVGLVGPVTNSIGNEAKINVDYRDLSTMDLFSERYTAKNRGKFFEISVLAMFCIALSRRVLDKVGLLDEQFSVGMFEDDDYALRVKKAGFKILCAEDVFIHHFGGASFGKLQSAEYERIFKENKKKYELKWGIAWEPHRYRDGV